jgi:hypothetical protein
MPMESFDIQFMGKGMMGYRMSEDDGHDQFAMVNMSERCTMPSESLKPSMVIKDFKFSRKAWVFPWGYKKTTNPTRSVILSRESGLQIKDLQHQLHEGELALDQQESKETREKIKELQTQMRSKKHEYKRDRDLEESRTRTKIENGQ